MKTLKKKHIIINSWILLKNTYLYRYSFILPVNLHTFLIMLIEVKTSNFSIYPSLRHLDKSFVSALKVSCLIFFSQSCTYCRKLR